MTIKYMLFAFLLFACIPAQAQVIDDTRQPNPLPYILSKADEMPTRDYDLNKYLAVNIHYPDSAKEHGTEGRVVIKFVVNEDGSISDCRIMKSVSKEIDEEALRVVSIMPPWKPGKMNGKPVKVYFTLPISFRLN